jgi:LacI family repressor for deo operon, udp, cdd, tsx, nupC, and nupG
MLRTKQADGLIQIGTLTPSGWELPENAGRIVLACEYYEGLPLPSVRIDNEQAAREAVSYLIALGHRRIATITGPMESRLGRDRLAGFKAAMADADLQIEDRFLSIGAFDLDSGKRGMQSLLSLRDRPTAVFCANDEMAMGALRALYEAGMRVPDDCSIMGFDDIRFAEYAIPPLTTIAQPNVAIGEAAMNLMLECLAGEGVIREVVLPHQLVVRGSTATIRRHPD